MRIATLSAAIITLILLAVAACTSNGDGGVSANEQAEWAECVSRLDRDPRFLPSHNIYDITKRQELMKQFSQAQVKPQP